MKPSFALQFTDTGITLLHRTGRGWLPLGDAAVDDPALGDNLGYLRATALGLEPQGITSKLVIPNDQILYTRVDAPGPEAGKRRNQIRRALEGRTPYGVEDLVFDWSGTGPEVMVAVIARETLAEAEAFAASHRFNPMSFVALPDPAQFDGEPFFGPSAHAATVLSGGDKVERDRAAMRIIARGDAGRAAAARAAAAEPDLPTPVPVPPALAEVLAESLAEALAAPVAPPQPAFSEPEPPVAASAAEPVPQPLAPPVAVPAVNLAKVEPEPQPAAAAAEPAAEWQPASVSAGTAVDLDLLPDTDADADADLAPFAAMVTGEPAPSSPAARFDLAASAADAPEAPAMFDVPMDDGDIPAMPHAGAAATFSSRRIGVASRMDGTAAEPALPPRLGPVVQTSSVTAPGLPGNGGADLPPPPPARAASRPQANGKVADPRAKLAAAGKSGAQQGAIARYVPMKGKAGSSSLVHAISRAGAVPAAAASADPVVDFTRRGLGTPAVRRGKPRYLGLILTVILLAVLAGVALWSSYFVGDSSTTPAASIGTATTGSDAKAALDPAAQDPAAVPLITPETTSSEALVEPPEADTSDTTVATDTTETTVATDATETTVAKVATETPLAPDTNESSLASDATVAPAAEPATESLTPAGATRPDLATADTAAEPAVTDATLSTSDQAALPDATAVEPATSAAAEAVPPAAESAAQTATADATPANAATTGSTAAAPEPAAATATATAKPETATTATATAESEPVPAATATAEPAAAEPLPPAPDAETDFAALTNGRLQDASDKLPELVGTEPGLQTGGAAVLSEPQALAGDSRPDTPLPPAPFGMFFDRDANGLVIATPEGAVTPEGALVIAGRPSLVPPPRPGGIIATPDPAAPDPAAAAPEPPVLQSDPALAGFRPKPRPAAPVSPQDETALQVEPQIATAATARPPERPVPAAGTDAAAVTAAVTAAGAAADPAALTAATNLAVAASRRPAQRPAGLAASISAALATVELAPPAAASPGQQPVVEAALAPAPRPAKPVVAEPAAKPQAAEPQAAAPEADNEPELASAAPSIPQSASVANQATLANAINLGKLNLIGVYGTANNRRALVRLASGRYVRVKVGDRVDGGQVAAIGDQDLRYIKNGRNLLLALPKDG